MDIQVDVTKFYEEVSRVIGMALMAGKHIV
jgi:hypothetical protein